MRARLARIASDPSRYLRRIPDWLLFKLSPYLQNRAFHLQSRMDIDPRGFSHSGPFVEETGGFFVPGDRVRRFVAPFDSYDGVRRDMLLLLLRSVVERNVPGDAAELGVYTGATARLIHEYLPDRIIRLFDTFQGFDSRDLERERPDLVDAQLFEDTTLEATRAYVGARVPDGIVLRPGYFPETLTEEDRARSYAFVHLDADLELPTRAGLEFFYPRMSPGGIIVVHDYNSWKGARTAVDTFFADKPEPAIPMPDKSGSAVVVRHIQH